MKKIALLVVLLLFTVCMSSQNEKVIDSLKNILVISNNDSLKGYTCIKIASLFRRNHKLDSSLFYLKIASKISNKNKFNGLKGQVLNAEGQIEARKTNYDIALSKFKKASIILEKENDLQGELASNGNIGTIYFQQNKLEEALPYYLKSIDLCRKKKSYKSEIIFNFNISLIYYQLKLYDKSLKYCFNAMKIKENNDLDKFFNTELFNQIGAVYYQKKDKIRAIEYFNKSLKIAIESKKVLNQILALNNIGELNLEINKITIAEKNFNDALKLLNSLETELEEFASIYISLAKVKLLQKKNSKGLDFAKKGLDFAKKQKQIEFERDAYSILSKLYSQKNNFKQAYFNSKQFKKLSDSLTNIESTTLVQEIETKYQTQQKENKILELSNKNNLQKASLAQSRLLNISGASLLLLLSGLGFFFWHKKKQQQKLAVLKTTVKTSENEKKRIGKELHDGIAGSLIRLVHDTEDVHVDLSHKLLHTYNEIRNLSHQLDNTPMHGEVFMERLIDLIPKNKKDQTFKFKISPNHLELQEPFGTHIYRIIQELITNNLKYAKAQKTELSILKKENKLTITYKDDGIGMAKFKKGNGYKNIEDRVTLMKGKLELNLKLEKGFELRIVVPYS